MAALLIYFQTTPVTYTCICSSNKNDKEMMKLVGGVVTQNRMRKESLQDSFPLSAIMRMTFKRELDGAGKFIFILHPHNITWCEVYDMTNTVHSVHSCLSCYIHGSPTW